MTTVVSKHVLPVFDTPLIYYPLSTLMLAEIREVLIISTPQDKPLFERLLGDGADIGMRFSYASQEAPRGLADAFIVGRDFVGTDPVALILGDNIFYGHGLPKMLSRGALPQQRSNYIWVFPVNNAGTIRVVAEPRCHRARALHVEEKAEAGKIQRGCDGPLLLR